MLMLQLVAFTFLCSSASAQNMQGSQQSVWAWEVKGKNRSIFLLGELHNFFLDPKSKIDHSLGLKISSLAEEIWMETPQEHDDLLQPRILVQDRVSPEIWLRLQKSVKDSIDFISTLSVDKKAELYISFVEATNLRDPLGAYGNLELLSDLKSIKSASIKYIAYPGFGAYLNTSLSKLSSAKVLAIEDSNAQSQSWRDTCNKTDANLLLNAGLKLEINDSRRLANRLSTIFLTPQDDLDELMRIHLSDVAGAILFKCSVTPRNYAWLPKVLTALEGQGAPVVFLVGIAHLWGDDGLISLLKKNGYTDVKRIYDVK